ncbi:MAG TPA: ABC transporter ATP-binding protein [Trebonia sp.]|nr:ABC transporter ATP-binding protein [Trebonia sp.]
MTALAVRALTVALDKSPVVREVSLATASGGWLAVIGPNGSGKSTLIRACGGLLPYTGSILFDDADLRSLRVRERARLIGYVPQEPVLPPDVTVEEYVLLGRTPHTGYFGLPGRRDRALAAAAMARLDVAGYAGRPLARLSGGERQRVVLARALAQAPSVLLLDEPTSMLDIGHEQSVLELVDGLRADDGLTVVSALHDLTLAGQYADQLVLLDGGRVAADGAAAEVLTAETIGRVYGARVTVTADPDGRPVVAPLRAPRRGDGPG